MRLEIGENRRTCQALFLSICSAELSEMRKSLIPKREIEVLKRLREAREKLGLAQPNFAEQIGITRGRLGNYEYFQTPLPCDLALRICNQFIIGERWLATGEGPMRQYLAIVGTPSVFRLPFGAAYDSALHEEAEALASEMEKEGTLFAMRPVTYWNPTNRKFYKNFFEVILDNWMTKLEAAGKTEDIGGLIEKLVVAGQDQFEFMLDRELRHDAKEDRFYWHRKSTGERIEIIEPPDRRAERAMQRERSKAFWEAALAKNK